MTYEENENYDTVYLEAQTNYVATDPYGNRFDIWQGMQFKWVGLEKTTDQCQSCGGKVTESIEYLIDAWAICHDEEKLWEGQTIKVPGKLFIETDNLKYPPIVNHIATELNGTDVDVFTHPKDRTVPRKGGLWYDDPWKSNRTE